MNFLENWIRDTRVQTALRIGFAVLITVVLSQFRLDVLEFNSYDLRAQWTPKPQPSGHVVLVRVDAESVKTLGREPEARDWSALFHSLRASRPLAVVSFTNPMEIPGSHQEKEALAQSTQGLPFLFGANDLPQTGQAEMARLPAPFEAWSVQPAPKALDRSVLARDGSARRMILDYEDRLTLPAKLASAFNNKTSAPQYAGTFRLLDSVQAFIRFRAKGAFTSYSFHDVMIGAFSPEDLKNKIVLIGSDTQVSSADYVTTPLSKEMLALSSLELQANTIDTLILNQSPRMTPDWLRLLITLAICFMTMEIVLKVRPGRGLLMLGGFVISYAVLSLAVFAAFNWVLPFAHPLVVVFICYYFLIPYRLIIENRKSWEYYQKNQLLTQVEELKSNFMRMMSHDLKTPLARIQGMAELIQKEESALNETQKKAVASISQSSEELTEFIGSILSLSRIESKEVKLHLQSRDINELVRQVTRKYDFMSKRKHIEVVTELEPLFSVKLDEDLIRQVLSNLLENAIKYSTEGAKVLISTEEADGQIVIQVADQGRGIAVDELPHVFERFYRGRDSRSDGTGSGLGLYLAKYFVELHNGTLEAESELGKGSTFTIRLPMDLNLEHKPFERGGPHA